MTWLIDLVKEHLLAVLSGLRRLVWNYVACPIKKLLFPVRDAGTGIKQSRMRYYRIEFSYPDGSRQFAYQEVNSNGSVVRYADPTGKRIIPKEPHGAQLISNSAFQFPAWSRVDWKDVFSGSLQSGCWGIVNR